jgi:hypothetical protein
MDNKRTIKSRLQEIDEWYRQVVDKEKNIKRKQEALYFKMQLLDKIYEEEQNKLEQE